VAGLLRRLFGSRDPYWDRFVNRPFVDSKNMVLDLITTSPGGGVLAVKTDVHDPPAMAGHMLQLAEFWGVDAAGVTATDPAWLPPQPVDGQGGDAPADTRALAEEFPRTIVCGVYPDFDPKAQGMGGRFAEQKLAVANFNLRSYIREIGYGAIFATPTVSGQVAAAAGLGTMDKDRRFISAAHGRELVLGQVVLTNLPMEPHRG
jgi:hypothetical protein